jgi:DHA2 family multidrug resistance protein
VKVVQRVPVRVDIRQGPNEATSFLTLIRSIGMSMGISIFEALVTQNAQVEHPVLAVFASPLNRAIDATRQMAHALSPMTAHGAALLNQMIDYQSQVIAYNDDYRLMAILSAPTLLVLLFMRTPKVGQGGGHAVMD